MEDPNSTIENKRKKLMQESCTCCEAGPDLDDQISTVQNILKNLMQERDRLLISSGMDAPSCKTRGRIETKGISLEGQISTCGEHSSVHHHYQEVLDPAVWGTLPDELLRMVFARLPLIDIIRLKSLSKGWRQTATGLEFRRACADVKPNFNMFALIMKSDWGSFTIRLYDMQTNSWHGFVMHTFLGIHFETMFASDGGLICFVSTSKDEYPEPEDDQQPLLMVCNPLTREWKILPPRPLVTNLPKMIQLVMDRSTKCYKVIVVGHEDFQGEVSADVYNSATGEWCTLNSPSDTACGYYYHWQSDSDAQFEGGLLEGTRLGPCIYDFAKNDLFYELDDEENPFEGDSVKGHALVGDHLFVLHEDVWDDRRSERAQQFTTYSIMECVGQTKPVPNWWPCMNHIFSEFKPPSHPVNFFMKLYACQGFLLVIANNRELDAYYREDLIWLYDLSTKTWDLLPTSPAKVTIESDNSVMCELRWDAVP